MKQYSTPTCDIVNIATEDVMATGMSIRIFNGDPKVIGEEMLITDGSEILVNKSKVWDSLDDNL